jgi:hypothetical protein
MDNTTHHQLSCKTTPDVHIKLPVRFTQRNQSWLNDFYAGVKMGCILQD